MTAVAPRVPEGLRELMKGFTKEVLREKPQNIYNFSLNYFETLLEKSDDYTVKEYEQTISYENINRVRDCNRVPVAIVFKIIPETLTELIKDFIKAVLRENPKNICEFGVDYFRSLQKNTVKNDDIQYTTYDNFFKNTEHLSLTPYAKCTCGRSFLTEVKKGKTNKEAPQQHVTSDKSGLSRLNSAYNPCLTHDVAFQQSPEEKSVVRENNSSPKNKPIENLHHDVNEEAYINAVYVIQKFFRNWVKTKQIKSNVSARESIPESFKISEEAAAVIIQRSLRKLFAKKCSQNLKHYPVIPILTNIQHEENNDNVSEAASYTSASTVRMSADSAAETMEMENSEYETIVSDEQTVSQTIMEVDEQQNERAADLELDKQPENSINSQKGKAKDMTKVDDDIDLRLSTREIQIKNEANNHSENFHKSLIEMNEESNKTISHLENIEATNTETKKEYLKMDSHVVKSTSNFEEEFIDPRLDNASQTIHRDDSSQEDIFANVTADKIEICESIENKENVSDDCSSTETQEFEKFNTTSEYILDDNKKDDVKLDGFCTENIFIENKIEGAIYDTDKHNIKKRHIQDPNIAFKEVTHNHEKYLDKHESQIFDIDVINTDVTEEANIFQNNHNVSSEDKLEKVKICNSEGSAQLETNQDVVGAHYTTADFDKSSLHNSEDQPASENVLIEIHISKTENIPTEQAIRNAESQDDILKQVSKNESSENIKDSLNKEKQQPELVKNSDQIKTIDSSLAEFATESLNAQSHQLYQEVEEIDKKVNFGTVECDNSVTRNSDDNTGESLAQTEISYNSNKLDKEPLQCESPINIETRETNSLEKSLLQESQEEEQHKIIDDDDSVKDNLKEINKSDKKNYSDQNKISIENDSEKLKKSCTDKQDSTEVNNTNEFHDKSSIQDQTSAELNEVKLLEELSHEVSKEAVDMNESGAIEIEIIDESTEVKVVNEIFHQISEVEHNNDEMNGTAHAENDKSKITTDSTEVINKDQISEVSRNNTNNSVELIENKQLEKLLYRTAQEAEEPHINKAFAAETPAEATNENPTDELLHQDYADDSNNGELDTTAIAVHKLTKINNAVQTSKEDSSPIHSTIESIQTTTQDEVVHEVAQEESGFTDKQDSIEINSQDQTSELGPNHKATTIESSHNSLENEAEKVNSPIHVKDDFTENSTLNQSSEKDSSTTESIIESSAQAKLWNNVSEKENDTENRDNLSTEKKDSTEVNNTNLTYDKHLDESAILAELSDKPTDKEQHETVHAAVPIECNLNESSNIHNSKEYSDKVRDSFESNKPVNEEELLHSVAVENNSKENLDSLSAVQQDSTEVINTDHYCVDGGRQIEIIADCNEVKPLEKLQYCISEEATNGKSTENVTESTKVKPLEEVLQEASEDYSKNGKIVAIASVEHDLMAVNNLDQISKIHSNNIIISVEPSQTTPHVDHSPMASQEDNEIGRKYALSTDTEGPTKVEHIDKDSKKGDDQSDNIIESREVLLLKENDHIFDKDQNESERLIETTNFTSLEEELDQELQSEEGHNSSKAVECVKNYPTDEKNLIQTEIAPESDATTPLDELLQQLPQDKEVNIVKATVNGDLTKTSNSSTSFKDNDQESKTNSISSTIIDSPEIQSKSNNLEIIQNEDGSTKISSIEESDDQDSTHSRNCINTNEIHSDAREPDSMRKEIGFESIQNDMQRAKISIHDIQIPEKVCLSEISEVQKEVIEEGLSEKLNDLNNEFSTKNNPKHLQSDEKDNHFEIHNKKDLETNRENLSTSSDSKDAYPLKSRNQETDMELDIHVLCRTVKVLRTTESLNAQSHQLYQEVEEIDKKVNFGTVECDNSVTRNSDDNTGESLAQTEISYNSNKLDKEPLQCESPINIETRETNSLEKSLLQESQEEEQHKIIDDDDSVKDNLKEINKSDKKNYSDQNKISIENDSEKLKKSCTDKQDSTEVNNTNEFHDKSSIQDQTSAELNEVKLLEELSHEVSKEAVDMNESGAIEIEIIDESTEVKVVNEIFHQISEVEHNNDEMNGTAHAENDKSKITTDSTEVINKDQISEVSRNNTNNSVELIENKQLEKLLYRTAQEAEEPHINKAFAAETPAEATNENPTDELLHQDYADDSNNGELDTTAIAVHKLTKINNAVQTSKEDSSPIHSTIESIQTTTQDEVVHEVAQEESGFTDKQDSIEINSQDQTSELGPNHKATTIESSHNSLENEAEKVNSPIHVKDDFTENSTLNQSSEKDSSTTESIIESSAQAKLWNNVSEKENDTENRDNLSTEKKDSTEVNNTNLTYDKHLDESAILAELSDKPTDKEQHETVHAAVPIECNLNESSNIHNSKEYSDKVRDSFESNKPVNEEELLHSVAVENNSKENLDSLSAVQQDSTEVINTDHYCVDGGRQIEIIADCNEVKPLEKLQYCISEEATNGKSTENVTESTKVKPLEEVLQEASEDYSKNGKIVAIASVEHDLMAVNNLDQISKIHSNNIIISVEPSQTTPHVDHSPMASQEDNEIGRKYALSTDTEGPTKVEHIDKDSKKGDDQSDNIIESREVLLLKENDHIFDKDQNESERLIETTNFTSLEEELDQELQSEEGHNSSKAVECVKNYPTDEKNLIQTEIAPESDATTPLDELLQQLPQDKEVNIVKATVNGDLTKTSNSSTSFKDNDQESKTNSISSTIIDSPEIQSKSNNLEIIQNEDGSTKISSIEESDDQDSTHSRNCINTNEIHSDAREPDSMRKEIGFESIQNDMQRAKISIHDIQIPEKVCLSEISEVQKEVIEEGLSEKLNDLNNEFSTKNNPKHLQSDEKDNHFEIHNKKDLETNRENLSTSSDSKDAYPLKSRNQETDMDAGETVHILPHSTIFEATTTTEVDTTHDTSTVSSNSPKIGTQDPFKNINRVDISESRNNLNNELNNKKGSIKNLESTSKLATVEKYEPPVTDMNIKSIHGPNETELYQSEIVASLISSNTEEGTSKDLDCEMLEKYDTKLRPRPENERTATYMYGVHRARQISSQTSKSLRKTTTSHNIPLLDNLSESSKSPRHTNQQSASIESNLNTERKANEKIASEESTVNSLSCKNTSETINTNDFSNSNKANGATLEKLNLIVDLDVNNNNFKNEIFLETPTKLFDELNIFDVNEKVQNTIVEASNERLNESKNNILPNLELYADDLNTLQLQSAANDLLHENASSEHSKTSSSGLKTIIELNESPRKSESEEADSEMKKHDMINVLNEPYDPLEFGSGSDNDSEFTNSWSCSKEIDENVLSDEFINEIYNETEPVHENKSKIVEDANTPQGGIYEMNPYDNLPIDSANTTLFLERKSNKEYESQREKEPMKELDTGDMNIYKEILSNSTKNEHERDDLSTKFEATEGESFEHIEAHESPLTHSATENTPSAILNSTSHGGQSNIFEYPVEKIETQTLKHKNALQKNGLSPVRKLSHESSETQCSSTEHSKPKKLLKNIPQVSINQVIPTETNRKTRSTSLAQEEIESFITSSQISTENEPALVATLEIPNEVLKREFNFDVDTENNDSNFVKQQSTEYKAPPVKESHPINIATDVETVPFLILNSTSHDEQNSVLMTSSEKDETYENKGTNILMKKVPSSKRNDSRENRCSVTDSSENQKLLENMPQDSENHSILNKTNRETTDTTSTLEEIEALLTPSQSTSENETPLMATIETPTEISNIEFNHNEVDFDAKDIGTSNVKEFSSKGKAASANEPPSTNNSTDVETVPPHDKQNVIVEPTMDKINTYENKHANILLKKELSPEIKLSHNSRETRDSSEPRKLSENISQVSEKHSILNEDIREIPDTIFTQEEIDALDNLSQSTVASKPSTNESSMVDKTETPKEISEREVNQSKIDYKTQNIDSSLLKEHSSECKAASINEPPSTNSSTNAETVPSHDEQNGILEPSIEKIETYEYNHSNFLLKKDLNPETKLSNNPSEKHCLAMNVTEPNEVLENVSQVSENHSILNETRDTTDITSNQKEIEVLVNPSQSTKTNEPPLVASSDDKFALDTEDIDTSIVKEHCLDGQRDCNTTVIDKDGVENSSLLDKYAIIIQTAYRKYNSSKNIPVSSEGLIKTQKLENKYGLAKSESSNDFSSTQNNAARVIQSLFRNYYAKKKNFHFTKVPYTNNINELTDIEESPPTYVEIMQENFNTDADISNERINNDKTGSNSSTVEEQTEISLGHDKEHKIEWFVGDELIVRSIPDTSAPLNRKNDLNALKQVVIDDSLVDIASQHSNKNSPTASSESATSPSINSVEKITVDSTSSLLEPVPISLSTNIKIKHSDGTVSEEEVEEERRHETPVTVTDDSNVFGSINEESNAETNKNQKETPIEKQLKEKVSAVKVISSKRLTNENDETITETSEIEIKHNEESEVTDSQSKSMSSDEQAYELSEERQNDEETSSKAPNIISAGIRTESAEDLKLATEFLNSRYSEQTNMFSSLNRFLDLEREYWESNIPFRCLEKPCIKASVPLKGIGNETTTSEKSNESEPDAVDSLEASTEKFRKTDEIIEKMQQKCAAESRVNSVDERLSAQGSFEEPIIKSMKELQETQPSAADDDKIVVIKPFQREDTRESSEQSDSVVFGSEDNSKNETDLVKGSLRRLYTIPGDDANVLFKTVTIDKTVKYIEPPESEMTGTSDSNSFCLDEDTSENIRQKMMAYSLSEADSDFLDTETRDDSGSMDKSSTSRDDFNITTALGDLDGTSTETESTIVSAATKIQAGARGFLTRRRLRRASNGTKTSLLEDNKASFGNAAIDESLERLIEEEAAKKIQSAYRKHYRQGKNALRSKNNPEDSTCSVESEEVGCKEAELNTFSSFETPLAARRHTLQRGDAMHNDSAPDEENIVYTDSDRTSKSLEVTSKEKYTINKETSCAAAADNGKKIKNQLKWIALRQNSMPVQIESEVFRVIPKHMRKRIKSAGGENKRRMRILKD